MPLAHDALGNPVTLADAGSLGALNDFVEGFIASQARAVNILRAANDDSPIVQACLAALYMFAETGDAPAQARPFVERALASPIAATARERRFVQAVAAWVDGDTARAAALHEEQAREFPRDLASLKLGHYHLFNRGDSPGMLRLALAALPAAADVSYMHGMAAFAWEQCHFMRQAEDAARRAIAMRADEPWAHHALAHVMLTEGRDAEGRDFLRDVCGTWTGLNSFMVTHNWWHFALFHIELGDGAEALRLYDTQVWGVAKDYSQDQVNAVSLLARLELAGLDVGDRWQDVGRHLAARTRDHALPFLDLQYLYGLARAGRPEADVLMANMAGFSSTLPPARQDAWLRVALPAARGLLAHARGDHGAAVDALGQALPRMTEIGGSHAQRDLFSQIHLDAMIRGGHLAGAQHVLQQQLREHPASARLRRRAADVYASLGLDPALAALV